MRGRGLKRVGTQRLCRSKDVAPHAGAWIETFVVTIVFYAESVAPHAGAWIETRSSSSAWSSSSSSPPMRGRGLKHVWLVVSTPRGDVALHAGAWIETSNILLLFDNCLTTF